MESEMQMEYFCCCFRIVCTQNAEALINRINIVCLLYGFDILPLVVLCIFIHYSGRLKSFGWI